MTDQPSVRPSDDQELPPPPVARGRDKALMVGVFVIFGLLAVLASLFIFTDAAFFRALHRDHPRVTRAASGAAIPSDARSISAASSAFKIGCANDVESGSRSRRVLIPPTLSC